MEPSKATVLLAVATKATVQAAEAQASAPADQDSGRVHPMRHVLN
ncbi:hypothetical protein GCM10011405_23980 [Rufibacter glacialis]|nr:hypothetical protein GCM10011405_23980 [Rufibacter glacialis]